MGVARTPALDPRGFETEPTSTISSLRSRRATPTRTCEREEDATRPARETADLPSMDEDRICGGSREHRHRQPRSSGAARQSALSLQKRQARVTVKYKRAELQKRLDTEQWIERALEELYTGAEEEMPEEIDIDDLLVLKTDEERTLKLQEMVQNCRNNTQGFISELLQMLHGLHKQEELQKEGIEHPCLHSYPHHHSNAHHHGEHHEHQQRTHQTL